MKATCRLVTFATIDAPIVARTRIGVRMNRALPSFPAIRPRYRGNVVGLRVPFRRQFGPDLRIGRTKR